ncbi:MULTISPECIES: hypothetical protein [Thermomonosporaceae]|nr:MULTISPECIES: hypothetical protein [Thermomonosporaceae]MDL4776085.1 hypothetical protein [Actinomadura xylanilytica]
MVFTAAERDYLEGQLLGRLAAIGPDGRAATPQRSGQGSRLAV